MPSPISQLPAEKVRDLPRNYLRQQLSEYFRSTAPEEVVEVDYSLWRCAETGLEFSEPPLPGNLAFYRWVSEFPYYYPGIRWEYGQVAALVKERGAPPNGVLDVGSGEGDFLLSLDVGKEVEKFALDMNQPAVDSCRSKGLSGYCGTVQAALAEGVVRGGQFDVVTSFHCLEHVPQPVEFLRELMSVTSPGGRIFVSTPASPMSFEADWFDVLNHPPHHLTRWNVPAYQKLATLLGVGMRDFAPRPSLLRQAVQVFCICRYGANVKPSFSRLWGDLLLGASQFNEIRRRLRRRAQRDPLGGSDVILVEFTLP